MILIFIISALVSTFVFAIHDYLSYCFMQEKKVGFSSLRQWWNGEIDRS